MRSYWLVLITVCIASTAQAQSVSDMVLQTPAPQGEGWQGFANVAFLTHAAFNLLLSAVLGAVIAYHPRHRLTADTFEEVEAAQIYILYAVIGSIIGILVVQYGMVVGFVLFGIGALIRFRTVLRSASLTGRLIFVTLIGLSAGLELPHVAVLVTVFGFLLIYLLDAHFTFRIDIRALPKESVATAADQYRTVLEQGDCRVISEKKFPDRGRVIFIVRSSRADTRKRLEKIFESEIQESFRQSVDWEIA